MESVLIFILLLGLIFFIALKKFYRERGSLPDQDSTDENPLKNLRSFNAKSKEPKAGSTTVTGPAYVIDGDTIVIRKIQMRLFGIDAPELNHPYGKKAKWALASLCKGQKIRAEISEVDCHGRSVACCYLQDGRDLSAEMVKLGLAVDWPKFSGGKYSSLEQPGTRKKLWLASARQKGHMHVWQRYEASLNDRSADK